MEVVLLASLFSFLVGAMLAVDIILRLQRTRRPTFFTLYEVPRRTLDKTAYRQTRNGWQIAGMASGVKIGTIDVLFKLN